MSMAFVVEIPSMDRNDGPRDTACLGIPAHMIANFEPSGHIAHLCYPTGGLGLPRQCGGRDGESVPPGDRVAIKVLA